MDLPPLYCIGIPLFVILMIVRTLFAVRRREAFDIGTIMGYIYTCFTTTVATTSGIIAGHFALTGQPYPGQSVETLQLMIFVAATIIVCGGLFFFYKNFDIGVEGQEAHATS